MREKEAVLAHVVSESQSSCKTVFVVVETHVKRVATQVLLKPHWVEIGTQVPFCPPSYAGALFATEPEHPDKKFPTIANPGTSAGREARHSCF